MDDSPKRAKQPSVAAFLFMPQFSLCFRQFSFIVPVFIRTVAVMFEQAGLLPPNHPATRYGVEGVKKYGFFELMGESWYTLRSKPATPLQWSLFASVVMMIVFIVASVVTVLMNLAGMFVGTASAQIFDGVNNAKTGMDTTPAASGGGMWDNTVPALGSDHSDYGIMILDKMLRQGAMQKGTPLQDGLGALFQIYNTGMLVIAGIMLFWAIIAIVLDTAKTGHVGGGRHNMVWAPIRIVVGLGLLIPLGASGFNSGQFMVMKIAEWGSNFGSRGWAAYVESTKYSKMVAKVTPDNTSRLASQYAKMWICRIAYNGYNYQAGVSNPEQLITQVDTKGQKYTNPESGAVTLSTRDTSAFTNKTAANLCGTITYAKDADGVLPPSSDALAQAIAAYETTIMDAYIKLFRDPSSAVATKTKEFSCKFVSQWIYGSDTADTPLATDCGYSGKAHGGVVPKDLIQTISNDIYTEVSKAASDAHAALEGKIDSLNLQAEMVGRGWPGMGMWYNKIAAVNTATAKARRAPISISEGELATFDETTSNPFSDGTDRANSLQARVKRMIDRYDRWWETVPAADPAAAPASAQAAGGALQAPTGKKDSLSVISIVKSGDSAGLVNSFAGSVLPSENPFLFVDGPGEKLYPLAMLTAVGERIVNVGATIWGVVTLLPLVLALIPGALPAGTMGVTLASSALVGALSSIGGIMFAAGIMLALWIPILPFIRVAFGVLTWMIAVFEAVAMVPVAALTHLSTEGEGIGGQVRGVWILWLNVLLRPILMVIGFVGAMLVFNTFVNYFTHAFGSLVKDLNGSNSSINGLAWLLSNTVYTVVYVGVIYVVANSVFKMIDMIPHAVAKYMGGHGDASMDQDVSGFVSQAGGGIGRASGAAPQASGKYLEGKMKERDEAKKPKVTPPASSTP